jgi:hypothetical protein
VQLPPWFQAAQPLMALFSASVMLPGPLGHVMLLTTPKSLRRCRDMRLEADTECIVYVMLRFPSTRTLGWRHVWDAWMPMPSSDPPDNGPNIPAAVYALVSTSLLVLSGPLPGG